ncbi:hypothetical protein ARMSODRAFT_967546 [Armillaria solidipes]|uniref:Uncharacterized protein n=1 Tax=Armillaria solidipes TaxID=1076256 RepID=A0A2H3B213_9AGAR|nr:hypothetical protein ARMSODRAFT_967546 [Armillaria solidipes]
MTPSSGESRTERPPTKRFHRAPGLLREDFEEQRAFVGWCYISCITTRNRIPLERQPFCMPQRASEERVQMY